MTKTELLGLKKAAIVLMAVADSLKDQAAARETRTLVKMVIQAANEIEAINIVKGMDNE